MSWCCKCEVTQEPARHPLVNSMTAGLMVFRRSLLNRHPGRYGWAGVPFSGFS